MPNNAGAVKVVLSIDAANYSAALDKAKRQMRQFGDETKAAGHGTVSSMQAASASIRLVEGGMTNNIRAVERFIGTLPGVSKALQTIFPLVGGIAFAGLLIKLGKEAYDFVEKMRAMPAGIATAFGEMNLASEKSNDELQLVNDKLAASIAKLEHKPVNELAIAIDQDKVAADNLAEAAHKAFNEVDKLLKEKSISTFWSPIANQQDTNKASGTARAYYQQLDDLSRAYQKAVRSGNAPLAADLDKQISDKRNSGIGKAEDEVNAITKQGPTATKYNQANINIYRGMQDQFQLEQDHVAEVAQNKSLEIQQRHDQDLKDAQERAKQAAQARYQGLESQYSTMQGRQTQGTLETEGDFGIRKIDEDKAFWASKITVFRSGSDQYREVLGKVAETEKAYNSEHARLVQEAIAEDAKYRQALRSITDLSDLSRSSDSNKELADAGKANVEWLRSMNQRVSIQDRNSNAVAEAGLQQDLATGKVSLFAAAQQQAALHTAEYNSALEDLQGNLDKINNDSSLGPEDKRAASSKVQDQIDALQSPRQIQTMQDSATIGAQTGSGAFTQMLDRMVQDSQDAAGQIRDIFGAVFSGLNESITRAMAGQKGGFSEAFRGIAQSVGGTALKGIEGGVLQHFGFGGGKKPTGNPGDAIHTIIDNAPGGSKDFLSGIAGGIGGSSTGSNSSSGGFVNTAIGIASSMFGGGMAVGGPVSANMHYLVGEKGPELLTMGSQSGHITPNNQIGGDTNHIWHIDARGSHDPAATEAAVQRGIKKAAPHIVAASIQAQKSMNARMPGSRRSA